MVYSSISFALLLNLTDFRNLLGLDILTPRLADKGHEDILVLIIYCNIILSIWNRFLIMIFEIS